MPNTPQPTPDGETILAAALTYAKRGWYVFPVHAPAKRGGCTCGHADCTNVGKHPLTRNGLKDASIDEKQIRAWWRKWPWANVAIVTGAKSGLLVLDIDILKGGLESFKAIQEQYGPLTSSLTSNTGSGGSHLLYAHPGAGYLLRNAQRLDGYAGLDVRGDGGYIVAPPSRHWAGTRYEWNLADEPVRALPDWLLTLLQRQRESGEGERIDRQPGEATPAEAQDAITHWTDKALPRAVEGARNATAFWWACQLRDAGVSQLDAESAAGMFYEGLGDKAGFALREVYNAIRSAYRQGPRERARSKSLPFGMPPMPHVTQPITDGTSAKQPQPEQSDEPKQRFRFLTLDEVKAFPPPEWLIDRILPAGRLSVVFGEYGSYKSFLVLAWALCVATGADWCGHEVKAGPVAYIAGEGIGGMGLRVRAWEAQHPDAPAARLWMLGDPPQLLNTQDVVQIIDAIRALPQAPVLVVIDTLARSMAGGDENSAQDMGLAVAAAERIRAEFGSHVLLVHHKPNGATRTRGSSALPGAADTLIDVTKDGDKLVTVTCPKQKDAEEFKSIYLRPEVVALDDYADATSVVLNARKEAPRPDEFLARSAQALLQLFRQLPAGEIRYTDLLTSWRAASGMSERSFKNALDELKGKGLIQATPRGWILTDKPDQFA